MLMMGNKLQMSPSSSSSSSSWLESHGTGKERAKAGLRMQQVQGFHGTLTKTKSSQTEIEDPELIQHTT
jgi:hypothetical protein